MILSLSEGFGEKLRLILNEPVTGNSLSGSKDKEQVCEDDRQPLEEDRGWAGVVQVLHQQHVSVKVLGHV